MHEGAGVLLLEMIGGGARGIERAQQMHLDDRLEIDDRHAVEDAVAQNAGVVDDAVDAAERVDGGLDDVGRGPRIGHRIEIGDRLAAGLADDLDDFLGRMRVAAAFAVGRAAEIVDHYLRALRRAKQRDLAPDAAPGAGDDHDPIGKALALGHSVSSLFSIERDIAPAPISGQSRD